MNHLDQIENRIKEIVEKSAGFLTQTNQFPMLVHRLCESIQDFLLHQEISDENFLSGFHIYMNPDDARLWKNQPDWQKTLTTAFTETMLEFGYKIESSPEFVLTARNSLEKGEIIIHAVNTVQTQEKTGVIKSKKTKNSDSSEIKQLHFPSLLINDNELIPLEKHVINIGRRSSNDIVLNDLRISRIHAQIRKSREGLMIFDVGSTGGTFINGERILNHLLRSGDVISLAGYTMIYTDENNAYPETKREKTADLSSNREK